VEAVREFALSQGRWLIELPATITSTQPERLPIGLCLLLIAGASAALWALIIAAVIYLF